MSEAAPAKPSAWDGFVWLNEPGSWVRNGIVAEGKEEGRNGSWELRENGILMVAPDSKKDFWCRTYYKPRLLKSDGPAFVRRVRAAEPMTVQVDFSVRAAHQFDQGGLVVWRDGDTWLKTGIEVVDGKPRLSCVVTRHGFSDWSTQPWAATSMRIRLSQTGDGSYVVEAAPWTPEHGGGTTDRQLEFCRIAYLPVVGADGGERGSSDGSGDDATAKAGSAAPTGGGASPSPAAAAGADSDVASHPTAPAQVCIGIFACCPASQKGDANVTFRNMTITPGVSFDHNADDNHE